MFFNDSIHEQFHEILENDDIYSELAGINHEIFNLRDDGSLPDLADDFLEVLYHMTEEILELYHGKADLEGPFPGVYQKGNYFRCVGAIAKDFNNVYHEILQDSGFQADVYGNYSEDEPKNILEDLDIHRFILAAEHFNRINEDLHYVTGMGKNKIGKYAEAIVELYE